VLILPLLFTLTALCAQNRVEYVGGTAQKLASGVPGTLDTSDPNYLAFYSKKAQLRVSYDRVNLLEYGQQVDRRLLLAVMISPVFLLSKQRKHFLTVGYLDEEGSHQALVFRVDKGSIRPALVSLEARTGQRIQYQDEEARKAGK
jgi:hypothetical protein